MDARFPRRSGVTSAVITPPYGIARSSTPPSASTYRSTPSPCGSPPKCRLLTGIDTPAVQARCRAAALCPQLADRIRAESSGTSSGISTSIIRPRHGLCSCTLALWRRSPRMAARRAASRTGRPSARTPANRITRPSRPQLDVRPVLRSSRGVSSTPSLRVCLHCASSWQGSRAFVPALTKARVSFAREALSTTPRRRRTPAASRACCTGPGSGSSAPTGQ